MLYSFSDFCSGIGGIRLGFEQTNRFNCIYSCELNKAACQTYELNFGHNPYGDMTKINPHDLPDFDVFAAGIPCQSWSNAGNQLGLSDSRGKLFFNAKEIIRIKQPKAFLIENVQGMSSNEEFKIIKSVLIEELGYHVSHSVLKACDYGIPQKRPRTYIVGFKNKVEFDFPQKIKLKTFVKDLLENKVEDKSFWVSKKHWEGLKKHKQKQKEAGRGFGYKIIDINGIANTLVCQEMGRTNNLIIDKNIPHDYDMNDEYIRVFTPREFARLQGFSDSFKFNCAKTVAWKQFGNSVAIPVIRSIAENIALCLDGKSVLREWGE